MTTSRKAIVSCGLGQFATNDPNAQAVFGPNAGQKAQELLAISVEKANKAGFDMVRCDANTQDYEDTLKRFTETLESREFVGINIGYGLRGHKGMTALTIRSLKMRKLTQDIIRAHGNLREDAEPSLEDPAWNQGYV